MDRDELIQQAIQNELKFRQIILDHDAGKWLTLDITIVQLKSLIFIRSRKMVNYRELSEALGITPSVVTGIVDRLIASGMLKRVEGTGDRRVHWLTLSDKGESLIIELKQENFKDFREVLQSMTDDDLSALVKGFKAFFETAMNYIESRQDIAINKYIGTLLPY